MEENLFNYLRQLCEPVWCHLFGKRASSRAIFRSLGELEQLIVLRLLNIKQPVSERALRLWMNASAIGDLRHALSVLQSYHIVHVSENRTKDGKQQYELHKEFRNCLIGSLYGDPCGFDDELEFLGNIDDLKQEDSVAFDNLKMPKMGAPTREFLLKRAKERLNFLLSFLVSIKVRNKTFRASKIARKIKKIKKENKESAPNAQINRKLRSMEDRVKNLTKDSGIISTDLLKILEDYDMISKVNQSKKILGGGGMSRQALSWLLKGVPSQIVIFLVGYLRRLECGYLTGCFTSKSVSSGGCEADQKSSLERTELAMRNVTTAVELLLSLSQARFGDCFSAKCLNKTQIRLLKFLSELGMVFLSPKKSVFYIYDLSYLIGGQNYTECVGLAGGSLDGMYRNSTFASDSGDNGIVVQSNFKVYVYTAIPLQISVLSHICELQARTPNLVVGVLTRESVQAAFKSGITADQIIRFFASKQHHGSARGNELRSCDGFQQEGLGIPENVARQLHMWESERNRLELRAAILFKRWDADYMPELFQRTVRWAQSKRYELFYTKWPSDPQSSEFEDWLKREKYIACTIECKEEAVEKIRQIRASLAEERAKMQ